MMSVFSRLLRSLGLRKAARPRQSSPAGYPGDYDGRVRTSYSPAPDGKPDPGEIVWTWVPFEENHAQGKDRPVLLIGRDGGWLLGLMLTSKDHNSPTHTDSHYVDIGSGLWDRAGRPSEVKVNRVIRVDPGSVRREGAVLDRGRFRAVTRALRSAGH
ncbi:type II toxin-antitoxin system PemK/MazF family toxin [Arthrobacter sp. NPDC090010]|uniref:type II toxin-antitoxin system PemK/MazF family toxin n=1 Tax=Arthrobacter sp. NPDC090010 TaxID=3363942 RepID=UPI0037F4B2AD